MRTYTSSCAIKKTILMCLVALMPICSSAQKSSLPEAKVMSFLSDYSLRYQARENNLDVLVSLFSNNLSSIYEANLKTKSRFTSKTLSHLLDAPIMIQKNRSVFIVDCAEVDIEAQACAVIKGEALLAGETSWQDVPKKIILGFAEIENQYLISYVQNGDEGDDDFSVWPSDPK